MNIARPFVIHLLPSSLASYVCSLSLCSSPCDKVGGCVGVCVCVSDVAVSLFLVRYKRLSTTMQRAEGVRGEWVWVCVRVHV